MSRVLSVVDPEQRNESSKKFRGLLFPEEGYDELSYVKKSMEVFEKLKNVKLFASAPKKG